MTESEEGSLKVLLEEMNDKFSLVLEGHDAIRHEVKEQIDEIKEEQQLFKSLLKGSHDELKSEIQGVHSELRETREELSTKIEAVGTKVDGHEDRIRFLERKTACLKQAFV